MGNSLKENSTNQHNKKGLADRCLVNETLTFIGKRWAMAVLYEISIGNDHFSLLRKNINGISDHILASRIGELSGQNLIIKNEIQNSIPVQIRYTLTAKGIELLKLVEGLNKWSNSWKS